MNERWENKMENKREKLTMEEMEKISGGLVVNDEINKRCWLVREDGTVIGPAPDEVSAADFAKAFSLSQRAITPEEYKTRFGRDLVW